MQITLTISDNSYTELKALSLEHKRTLEQEAIYRLEQGMRMQNHLSEHDSAFLKLVLALVTERKEFC